MKLTPTPIARLMLAALSILSVPVWAHGDEDHSQDNKAATVKTAPAANGLTTEMVAAQRLSDGSLFVPKAVQRQMSVSTVMIKMQKVAATVEFNGRVIADANFGGRVQASQAGRIEAGPKGLPTLGQAVTKGQILAYLRPAVSSIERGNTQAQLAELESQLAIAERKVQRYQQLEGSVPQSTIDVARLDWEALKIRRSAVGAGLNAPQALLAPSSGIISASNAVLGQVVDAKDVLFDIVDPARLSVEALAYDSALLTGLASASAVVSGGTLALQFIGGGHQLREQALPLLFRVKTGTVPLAVGQPVKVLAQTSRTTQGASVVQAALIKGPSGETSVWVHTGAERFVLRKVSAQPLDAIHVALTAGVADGDRVVTEGAGLLAQVK